MAEAFFNEEMTKRGITGYRATSAGTAPSDSANPSVVAVMAEVGLSIPNTPGRLLTPHLTDNAVKFISMGCGDADACPARLRHDMEDWDIPDPKGKSVEEVREIRSMVRQGPLVDRRPGTLMASSRRSLDGPNSCDQEV